MKLTRFDQRAELIIVGARLWGPLGTTNLRMVLDTGAAMTTVVPEMLDALGYNPRNAERVTRIRSAVAEEPGYAIRVKRFRALGFEQADFLVHAHDLPDGYDIHGLLGLDYLRRFDLEIRCGQGRILATERRQ